MALVLTVYMCALSIFLNTYSTFKKPLKMNVQKQARKKKSETMSSCVFARKLGWLVRVRL